MSTDHILSQAPLINIQKFGRGTRRGAIQITQPKPGSLNRIIDFQVKEQPMNLPGIVIVIRDNQIESIHTDTQEPVSIIDLTNKTAYVATTTAIRDIPESASILIGEDAE